MVYEMTQRVKVSRQCRVHMNNATEAWTPCKLHTNIKAFEMLTQRNKAEYTQVVICSSQPVRNANVSRKQGS